MVVFFFVLFLFSEIYSGITLDINDSLYYLEAARTKEDHFKGLMYRTDLSANKGMIFIYEKPKFISIWMKNTFIRLDILWLNESKHIVHMVLDPPVDSDVVYTSPIISKYVIELPAGTVHDLGLHLNDKLDLHF